MSKTAYILISALVVVVAAIVIFGRNDAASDPTSSESATETAEITDNTTDTDGGDSVDLSMPVPGLEEPVNDVEVVDEPAVEAKVFTVDSFSFGYDVTEIRVAEGDTVTINLTNSGGFHDWVVDEFNAATEKIAEGENTSVTFVADKAGTYEFYCSVGSHRAQGMVGTLVVQ